MINFENSDISNIVIHHVGNKFEGGGLLEICRSTKVVSYPKIPMW